MVAKRSARWEVRDVMMLLMLVLKLDILIKADAQWNIVDSKVWFRRDAMQRGCGARKSRSSPWSLDPSSSESAASASSSSSWALIDL